MTDYRFLRDETPAPHVVRVVLNRPEVANALHHGLIDDLLTPSIAVVDGICTTGALEPAFAGRPSAEAGKAWLQGGQAG
jgi:enoyl-CoA hydratase/carnithine racemase